MFIAKSRYSSSLVVANCSVGPFKSELVNIYDIVFLHFLAFHSKRACLNATESIDFAIFIISPVIRLLV